jgi:hypothetical protein
MRSLILTLALLLALTSPALAKKVNCNGPGDDNCGNVVEGTDPQPSICDITVGDIAQECANACEANCTNECPACPDVTVLSRPVRCAKVKQLRDGRFVGRRCVMVTETSAN